MKTLKRQVLKRLSEPLSHVRIFTELTRRGGLEQPVTAIPQRLRNGGKISSPLLDSDRRQYSRPEHLTFYAVRARRTFSSRLFRLGPLRENLPDSLNIFWEFHQSPPQSSPNFARSKAA